MAMQSPSSSFSYGFTYDVFLSFRGSDTRYGFTGNLYRALCDKGIHTFIDDRELQGGDEITPSLRKAIEESRIFIPVLSISYASSSFCLDELVHIIHCFKEYGRLVLPIFYDVEPSHVRHQGGSYGKALDDHIKKFQKNKDSMERLKKWKMALTQTANFSGYHFNSRNGYEYEYIQNIVKYVSNKINHVPLYVAGYPVGLESRVLRVNSLIDVESNGEVQMLGIYGIGGMGKTTLARAVYNSIADQFDGLCFLNGIRENSDKYGLENLQEKLLSKLVELDVELVDVNEGIPIIMQRLHRKKVLLILDDVHELKQLQVLAGGLDWFGPGSRVIITTQNKQLLACHGIGKTYAVKGLNETEALELLRWTAFKNGKVPSRYEKILKRVVAYASGLPLVLEVVGSNLFGKNLEEWKSTLDKYEKIPNKEIQSILKVAFDSLEEDEQSVFLDIACCFKGCKWATVKEILHGHYGHCMNHQVEVLVENCLIDHLEDDSYVTLHDMIANMGKEVVRQESPEEPGERSRLWSQDDIVHVLRENTGTSKIQMIYMNLHSMESVIDKNGKAFRKMTHLKTFITENVCHIESLKYLPRSLRVMKGCILRSPSSSSLNKKLENMKVLIFDNCQDLIYIPDVSWLPNLEKFSFARCHNLVAIHNSLRYLNELKILNAEGCEKLESFPPLQSPSLQNLELSNCKSLKSFPELLCKMANIKSIYLKETSIGEFPFSFQNLSELSHLTISGDNLKMNLLKILRLDECKCFEENQGIPSNLEMFSGFQCKSWRKIKGHNISFWFRKKIPSRTIIILLLCLSMGINILFLTKHFAVWETRA